MQRVFTNEHYRKLYFVKTSELLKSIRTANKWTQAKMAEEIGLGRAYYSQLESGKKPIKEWIISEARDLASTYAPFAGEQTISPSKRVPIESSSESEALSNPSFVHAFSQNLKSLRGERPQRLFARLMGFDNQATYHRYEAGRIPRPNVLARIAYRLGVPVEDVLSPLSTLRIKEIAARLDGPAPNPEQQPWDSRKQARVAVMREIGKLLKPENLKAAREAFGLSDLSGQELKQAAKHFSAAEEEVEISLQRFYSLILEAIREELHQRAKNKK